jgi:putative copper export protein
MIIEWLNPDPDIWDAVTVVLRAGYYAASLTAAGMVAVLVVMGHRLDDSERKVAARLAAALAIAALVLSIIALGTRVMVLTAGTKPFDPAIWSTVMRSRIGDAFFVRGAGLLALLFVLARHPAGPALALIGAVAIVVSYAAMGHSMLYRPRQELAALVIIHLAAVAWWAGSLPILSRVAQRRDAHAAARLIDDWSHGAMAGVAVLAVSGLVLAWLLVGSIRDLLASWYGWGLMAKVLVVAVVLGLAALNKWRLTPDLRAGLPGAGAALARAIRIETVMVLLVFYAAAEMTSVHPIDYGHRIAG